MDLGIEGVSGLNLGRSVVEWLKLLKLGVGGVSGMAGGVEANRKSVSGAFDWIGGDANA